jgi:hypothetical protein
VAVEYEIGPDGKKYYPRRFEGSPLSDGTIPAVTVWTPDPPNSSTVFGPGTKPDGTLIDPISTPPSNVNQGSARRQILDIWESSGLPGTGSGLPGIGATIDPNKLGKEEQDPTKTGRDVTLGEIVVDAVLPFEGPYDNILENFSTYNALWTLACLEPNQFNNPSTYRDNPAALTSVVFSSAGRFEAGRVSTVNGTPEYFVDNVEISALITPVNNGNTNAIGFSFDIYEPYSMGLFLQSLQAAAINAGYPNYLGRVPYLFKLDFIGNTDDGDLKNTITAFTKYFTMQITGVTQAVDASGSRYTVTAVPFHHMGFNDSANNVKSAVKLTGGSISEVLATGENSLVNYLNKIEDELVKGGKQDYPDIYEIVFPTDESDNLGISSPSSSLNFGATLNPREIAQTIIKSAASQVSGNVGGNAISESSMNFSAEVGGNYVKPKESDVVDNDTGVTDREKMRIDPNSRVFQFSAGERITQIIQKVILVSDYAAQAIDPKNLTNAGMAKWFRVDVQSQLLDYDQKRNTRARKIIYRVLPYLVDGYILKNPSAPLPGIPEREKVVAKRYDYIYSGRNNNILDLNLEFNTMFYTGVTPREMATGGSRNPDTDNAVDVPEQAAEVNTGGSSTVTSASGSSEVGPDPATVKRSPTGEKTLFEQIADVFQTRFQQSSADMVNVEMKILGDPYFLSDSGINSNYFSPKGINFQITGDNALNYEGSDIWVYITFRTPIEPNLSVSGEGGLFDFQNGGGVSPYSGFYKVIKVDNNFSNGTFTQTLKLLRPPGQPNDLVGQEAIVKENNSLYGRIFSLAPRNSPTSDPSTQAEPSGLDRLSNLVSGVEGAVGTVSGIISSVSRGNITGAISSVGGILEGVSRISTNQRPTSREASAASQTTSSFAQQPSSGGFFSGISGVPESARAVRFNNSPSTRSTAPDPLFSRESILAERQANIQRSAATEARLAEQSRGVTLTASDRRLIEQGNREIARADAFNQRQLPRR